MKVETYIVMNRDEINSNIPYPIVAETMSGSRWNTGKRKRALPQTFIFFLMSRIISAGVTEHVLSRFHV